MSSGKRRAKAWAVRVAASLLLETGLSGAVFAEASADTQGSSARPARTGPRSGHPAPSAFGARVAREVIRAGGECRADAECPSGPCVDGTCVVCSDGPDCDADGIADACAIAAARVPDCDGNGRPDACDLDEGALDCNQSGIPDACEALAPRCTLEDPRGFVTYLSGTLPVVLTAPHGGSQRPEDLADRTGSAPVDTHTLALSEAIDAALFERSGQRPHRIVVNLHRRKLDANRDLDEAAQGDPEAEKAWRAFHRFVDAARSAVETRHGRGLLLDVHGLGAARKKNEIGILLSGAQLAQDDRRLSHPAYAASTSIRALVERSGRSLPELIRGPQSFGERLTRAGHDSVPSATFPDVGRGDGRDLYFSGGYITWRHGSRRSGQIDAIQLETTARIRTSQEQRARFAEAVAEALMATFRDDYRHPLTARTRVRTLGPAGPAFSDESVRMRFRRSAPYRAPLSLPVEGPSGRRTLSFGKGQVTATADMPLAGVAEGSIHRVRPVGSATVAVDDGWDIDIETREAPRPRLEVHPEVLVSGEEAVFRVVRAGPGPDLPSAALRADGVGWSRVLRLGLTSGATAAEGRSSLTLDRLGGRTVTLSLGVLQHTVRVEDPRIDKDLFLWVDARRPLTENRASHPVELLELPKPIVRAPTGPRPPAFEFLGAEGRLKVGGLRYERGPSRGYTVAFWFRPNPWSPNGLQYVWSQGRLAQDSSLNIYLTPAGVLQTALRGKDDPYDPSALDAGRIDFRDGRFHHYALVVRRGPNAVVYIDGQVAARAQRGQPFGVPKTGLHIGGRHDLDPMREFDGLIDELKVWNRPLSPREVRLEARR